MNLHSSRIVPDTDQQRLLDLGPHTSALVTGLAGSGKSTAALVRLASLQRGADRERRPFSSLVLVPTTGLVATIARALARIGVRATVSTVDDWFGSEARRLFPGLGDRPSEGATPGVLAFKRHPAVAEVLPSVVGAGRRAERDDLFALWGDRDLLDDVIAASAGALAERWADEVERHAAIQFWEINVDEHGRPLLGADGHPLHFGTTLHDACTADVVDLPVLFELDRQGRGHGRPRRYDHVVVDEAQELAPLELAVIGRAIARGGALTLTGDAAQQVDPTAWFAGWHRSGEALAVPLTPVALIGSHRCPPEVTALARRLAEGLPMSPTPSRAVRLVSPGQALGTVLASLPGGGSHAVITRTVESARRVWRTLGGGARLVLDGPFDDRPGIVVTAVTQVRGLEFDEVVVAELDPVQWPDDPPVRNALGVAITRARKGVSLSTSGAWSPLV